MIRHSSFVIRHSLPLFLALLFSSCAAAPQPVFPPIANAPRWPTAPDTPRIFYVGQLKTADDLKPNVNGLEALGQAIFGKKENHAMLSPFAVTTDNADRIFVADSNAQLVHVFNINTRKYATWIPGKGRTPFTQPVGLAWLPNPSAPSDAADSSLKSQAPGLLLVTDSVNSLITVFDTNGNTVSQFGQDILQRPVGIVADTARQRLLVADVKAHQLLALSYDGKLLQRIGSRGVQLGQFNFPTNLALAPDGSLYVADSLNFRIQQFDPDLKPLRQVGRKGDMPGYFAQPKGVATDSEGHLYVLDAQFENIQLFSPDGQILMDFGEEGTGMGEFWLPTAIAIDKNNRIYVADSYNRRIQVFDYKTPQPTTQPASTPETQP